MAERGRSVKKKCRNSFARHRCLGLGRGSGRGGYLFHVLLIGFSVGSDVGDERTKDDLKDFGLSYRKVGFPIIWVGRLLVGRFGGKVRGLVHHVELELSTSHPYGDGKKPGRCRSLGLGGEV